MGLSVYNTRARSKEPFEPLTPGRVNVYVCGPTVYDHPHLGHARAAVAFDVIRRTFEALGYRVTYVQNITDVDDKIIARAGEEGASPWEIAERYGRAYEDAMRALGVRAPTLTPKATGHITDMIELIRRLIDAGVAYVLEDGDVYFSVERFAAYGGLSGRSLEDMRAGERVEPDPRKRHPMDFALWKSAKEWQVSWPAPWGAGRPGWHIECSAMSMKYLGETFDVHGGGQDLIFPHHENEAAQSEAVTGQPLARYWLHNGFVTINQEKMAKSTKNYVLLRDVLAEHPPPVVRLMLAAVHYRSPLDLSPDVLDDARGQWDRFATFARNAADALVGHAGGSAEGNARAERAGNAERDGAGRGAEYRKRFLAAMEDDFNTPEAFAVLHELVSEANPLVEKIEAGSPDQLDALTDLFGAFGDLAGVLGLDPVSDWPEDRNRARVAPLVDYLLRLREEARAAKDYARADAVRDAIARAGVVVEDRPGGARWHLADPWS